MFLEISPPGGLAKRNPLPYIIRAYGGLRLRLIRPMVSELEGRESYGGSAVTITRSGGRMNAQAVGN